MKDDQMDALFHALASRERRRILDLVKHQPGCCVNDVCAHFSISRVAVLKHLKVLDAARLILSERVGRQRLLYLNAVPIQMVHERWTTEFSAYWSSQLTQLKYRIEQENPT